MVGANPLSLADSSTTGFPTTLRVVPAGVRASEGGGPAVAWSGVAYKGLRREIEVVREWQKTALPAAEGRVVIDPNVMDGVPVVANTRIPAHVVLDCLADGDGVSAVAARFPALTTEDVYAVLAYAAGLTGG